jgi:hypothetical protein
MQNVTEHDMKQLISIEDKWCISIFMPANPVSTSADKNRIRFKSLLRKTEAILKPLNIDLKTTRAMIAKGEHLLEDTLFWRYQRNGLAVFIAWEHFYVYRLPATFNERVRVGCRFFVKPLVPLLMMDCRFYLLTLSWETIRLFSFTPHEITEIDLGDLPGRVRSAFEYDNKQSQLHYHTGTPPAGRGKGERPAIFHGQGVGIDASKDEVYRYFQRLNRELRDFLDEADTPLLLAGVDYLLPLFKKASDYDPILDEGITGNPDELTPKQLHEAALEIVSDEMEKQWRRHAQHYRDLAGKGYTAAGVHQVVPSAAYGRVKDLFVALDENCPGMFDSNKNQLWLTESREDNPVIEDLFNRAVVETIRHGGNVFGLRKNHMPERDTGLAAILRY